MPTNLHCVGFNPLLNATLFHNRQNTIGYCLHDSFLFSRHFQSFEAQIVPPVTRCLNCRTDLDVISILDFRVSHEWSSTNAQYCNRNRRIVVFQTEQIRTIAIISVRNGVGSQGVHISHNASNGHMPKMVDPWLFEYLLNAGRFFCPHWYRCGCSYKREQNDDERSEDSRRSDHGG